MEHLFDTVSKRMANAVTRREAFRAGGQVLLAAFSFSSIGRFWGALRHDSPSLSSTVTCPSCGTCQTYTVTTGVFGTCTNPCTAAQLCTRALAFTAFTTLDSLLTTSLGYSVNGQPYATIAINPGVATVQILAQSYTGPATGAVAILYFQVKAKTAQAYAVTFFNNKPLSAYAVGIGGTIEEFLPPYDLVKTADTFEHQSLDVVAEQDEDIRAQNAPPPLSTQTCTTSVSTVCTSLTTSRCKDAATAVCTAAISVGIEVPPIACQLTVQGICAVTTVTICNLLAKLVCKCPTGQQYCNGTCCGPCMSCNNNVCQSNCTCSTCVQNACVQTCPSGEVPCGCNNCVPFGTICCGSTTCPAGMSCCSIGSGAFQTCCYDPTTAVCCSYSGQAVCCGGCGKDCTCCGTLCCPPGWTCCLPSGYCCPPSSPTCVNGGCGP